jgi:hypothetical protein
MEETLKGGRDPPWAVVPLERERERERERETLFNSFLKNYLRIFYNHFPQHKFIKRHNHTPWMTKISCKHKRFLYLCTRSSNDSSLKKHYKQYCKILANVINEANKYIIIIKLINQQIKLKQLGTLFKRKLTDIRD